MYTTDIQLWYSAETKACLPESEAPGHSDKLCAVRVASAGTLVAEKLVSVVGLAVDLHSPWDDLQYRRV